MAAGGGPPRVARAADRRLPSLALRTHPDAEITMADYVAEAPDIQLR